MTAEKIKEYCLSKHKAYETYPFGDVPVCFKLNNKIFAQLYPYEWDYKIRTTRTFKDPIQTYQRMGYLYGQTADLIVRYFNKILNVDYSTITTSNFLDSITYDVAYLLEEKDVKTYVDYVKRNNPYGYDREKLASLGLGSSGAERKALSDSFSEYQSYLGRALSEKADIHKNLVNELVHSQLENDEKRKQYALEDAKAKMENYWREYEWDYIRNRDKIEDERYEKELRG